MGREARENKKYWEELEKRKQATRCQEITDAPPQLMVKGRLCNFFLEYGLCGRHWSPENKEDQSLAYMSGYKDAETGEILINSGGYTPDYAISNLLNRLKNGWHLDLKDADGKEINIVECILYKGEEVTYNVRIDKHYIVKPNFHTDQDGNFHWNVCPMCGGTELEIEPYNTLCPEALAGRKGTRYYCKCGYEWDEVEMMM